MSSNGIIDILKPIDYDEEEERYRKVSIVVVSDTHKKHQMIRIPDGDIFLHCGDFTNKGDWRSVSDGMIPQSVIDFNQWLETLPHRFKIVIGGNHELGFSELSQKEIQEKYLSNCIYLKDESIKIEGISIHGSPWSFEENFRRKWSLIPSDIDILMTHIPPQFILDLAYQPKANLSMEPCSQCANVVHGCYGHWGSSSLIKEIRQRIRPLVHCFGHVHDHPGHKYDQHQTGTLFINAAADLSRRASQFNFYVSL